MANPNFSAPAISNKIASDIDSIRELAKLIARLRGDLADNAPDGTIIFNQTVMNFQMKNGTVWSALDDGTGKYAFNVDKLDGFHANAGIIANSIVVRDSKGVIPGNISGRAPNATQADKLTTVNPIAKGGTGASTAAQARANLGTNDVGNLTAGVLPFKRGGTGRTDGSAQDVQTPSEEVNANNSTAKGRGQIGGLAMGRGIGTDANLFTGNGRFWFNNSDALVNFPNNNIGGSLTVRAYAMYSHQDYINYNDTGRFWRISQNTGNTWTPWYRVPEGLTDNYTTNSSVVAASAKALMNLKAYADTKLPLAGGALTGSLSIKNTLDLINAAPATEQELGLFMLDKNNNIMGGHDFVHSTGNLKISQMYARNSSGLISSLGVYVSEDGTRYTLSSHNLVLTSDVEIGRLYADGVRLIKFSGTHGNEGLAMRYSPDSGELYLDGRAVHGKADAAKAADFASEAQIAFGLKGMDLIIARTTYTLPNYGTWKYMFMIADASHFYDMVIGEDPGGRTFFPTQMGWPEGSFMDGIAFRSA